MIAATIVFSCGPKEEKETEVIVIEKEVEKEPVQEPAAEEKSGTSIEVGKDGVKVSSEKTSIDVKDGKAKVELNK